MKPPPFDYHAPGTVAEATALLGELADQDPKLIAGGQSLVPLMNLRLARPGVLVDLRHLDELRGITAIPGGWRIGALTRHAAVEDSAELRRALPIVPYGVSQIGYRAIRNRGTAGGSVCHADPAAEWPLLAALLDATFEVVGPDGERSMRAAEFFQGFFTTALAEAEVLRSLHVVDPGVHRWGFVEFTHRVGDFAIVAVGVLLGVEAGQVSWARLAAAGMGDTPRRLTSAEAALIGTGVDDRSAHDRAADAALADVDPTADAGGSVDYKRTLLQVHLRRALAGARQMGAAA